jgi:tetratricopeptide (TPR) repeat protein
MSWLGRLFGGRSLSELKPQRLDYLAEALMLERQGDLDAALTSYRLALREKPDDHRVLVNMAIAYTRLQRSDEAIRCYRRALELASPLPGAHYGLAFLLRKRGEGEEAINHLEAFLAGPGKSADPESIAHARRTVEEIRSGPAEPGEESLDGQEPEDES